MMECARGLRASPGIRPVTREDRDPAAESRSGPPGPEGQGSRAGQAAVLSPGGLTEGTVPTCGSSQNSKTSTHHQETPQTLHSEPPLLERSRS